MADVLKKVKYQVDKESLDKIYFSFIRPKLEFGNYIWDNCFEGDKDRLEDFQPSIAMTVTRARKGTSHDLIYHKLNIGHPCLIGERVSNKKIFLRSSTMKHLHIFVHFFQKG